MNDLVPVGERKRGSTRRQQAAKHVPRAKDVAKVGSLRLYINYVVSVFAKSVSVSELRLLRICATHPSIYQSRHPTKNPSQGPNNPGGRGGEVELQLVTGRQAVQRSGIVMEKKIMGGREGGGYVREGGRNGNFKLGGVEGGLRVRVEGKGEGEGEVCPLSTVA